MSWVIDTLPGVAPSLRQRVAQAGPAYGPLCGDLRLRVANLDSSSQLMYRLGHQAIFAAVGIAGGAFALVLEGRGELERAGWGWWTARVCGALMVWSWWSSRGLLRRKAK